MAGRPRNKGHKKIKDPYAIIRERNKGKMFDRKPADAEDEFVPKKMQALMNVVDQVANGTYKKTRKRKKKLKNGRITSREFVEVEKPQKGMTRPLKPIPLFEQRPKESDFKFLRRVQRMTKERIQQSRFEDKYNVDIMHDPETGERKMVSREDGEEVKSRKKKRAGDDEKDAAKKINRKKQAKLKKKQRLEGKVDDFAHLTDRVKFGEVVQRPPDIKSTPRNVPPAGSGGKVGERSLLLKKVFTQNQAGASSSSAPKSLSQRAALEAERLRAVAAYRSLKQNKHRTGAKLKLPGRSQ